MIVRFTRREAYRTPGEFRCTLEVNIPDAIRKEDAIFEATQFLHEVVHSPEQWILIRTEL